MISNQKSISSVDISMDSNFNSTKAKLSWCVAVAFFILFSYIINPMQAEAGLRDGLVGHWTFDGKDTVWTSSTTATTLDKSGQGNTGTLTSMNRSASPVLGKVGQGLKFGGVDDFILLTSNVSFSGQFTISMWFKRDSLDTNDFFTGSNVTSGCKIGYMANTHDLFVRLGGCSGGGTTVTVNATLNNWHQLVVVRNASGNVSGYLDGGSAISFGTQAGTSYFRVFGLDDGSGLNYFHGKIDDVRIYNRALSAQEITQLYKTGATKMGVTPVATTTAQKGINAGLVGHWTFDGKDTNWRTNTTNDLSGQGNTGTLTTMSTTTSPVVGRIGQGLDIYASGGNGYVNVGDPASGVLDFAGDFTVSVWVINRGYINQGSGTNYVLGKGAVVATGQVGYAFGHNSGVPRFEVATTTTAVDRLNLSMTNDIRDGKWHLLTGVRNGTVVSAYLDGTLKNTGVIQAGSSVANAHHLNIGTNTGLTSHNFNGKIDDVRLYNRALSEQEIQQLYKLGATKMGVTPVATTTAQKGISAGLVGHWTFDGKDTVWTSSTAATTLDKSGNGNTGTLTSMSRSTSVNVGKVGQALNFVDNTTQYVKVNTSGSINNLGPMSISLWVKPRSTGAAGFTKMIAKDTSLSANSWQLMLLTQTADACNGAVTNALDFEVTNSAVSLYASKCSASNAITMNQWQHVVVTWDGTAGNSGAKLYINGVEPSYSSPVSGGSGSRSAETYDLYIGNRRGLARSVDGALDDVRIYNRALSAQEIQQLYKTGFSISR